MSNRDVNPSQGFGATRDQLDWGAEETYWRDTWRTRPYATAARDFDYYRPAYRYGLASAGRHRGRQLNEVETDLRTAWARVEQRGHHIWENVKDAVRDAWHRVTNR